MHRLGRGLVLAVLVAVPAWAEEPTQPKPTDATPIEPKAAGDAPAGPEPVPLDRLVAFHLALIRYNPLALHYTGRAGWMHRLYESSKPVLSDNNVFIGIAPSINPAYAKIGAFAQIQPVSVFSVRVIATYMFFFGTFDTLQSFVSPLDDYSDHYRHELGIARSNYASSGVHVAAEADLQGQIGRIQFRNRVTLDYYDLKLRPGDRVFYESISDSLVPNAGWSVLDDLDVLYATRFGLKAGLRYSMSVPLYRARDFSDGEVPGFAQNSQARVGPQAYYAFSERSYAAFGKPTVGVILQWYLFHRYRAGQEINRAIPYVIVGFIFEDNLLL